MFEHPLSLVFFALLGVGCGLLARVLFALFFRIERLFKRLPLWLATTIGGLCIGLVGLVVPTRAWNRLWLGAIRNWKRRGVAHHPAGPALGLFGILLVASFAEILGASLTLGSGNSGGIFGPCVVTGGMFGGAFGYGWPTTSSPRRRPHPGNFAIVGMMAFFAAAAKAPISTIIMISEMTGGYGLLAPAMFAVVTAFILSGRKPSSRRKSTAAWIRRFTPMSSSRSCCAGSRPAT